MSAGLPGAILSGRTDMSAGFIQNGNSFGAAAVLGTNDANTLSFETSGTTRFTVSALAAVLTGPAGGSTYVGGTGAGDDLILRATANAADGDIIFQSDPTTERARFTSIGELFVGVSVSQQGEFVSFYRNQNANSFVEIGNTDVGASAQARLNLRNDVADALTILCRSNAFAGSGPEPAGSVSAILGNGNPLVVYTASADALIFGTNNTRVGSFLSGAEFIVGSNTAMPGVGTNEFVGLLRNANSIQTVVVRNSNAGASAETRLEVYNDTTSALQLIARSSTSAASGAFPAGTSFGVIGNIGPLIIGTGGATDLILATGGPSTEVGRMRAAGDREFLYGTTSLPFSAGEFFVVSRSADATRRAVFQNLSAGASALFTLMVSNNLGNSLELVQLSSGHAGTGPIPAAGAAVRGNVSPLVVYTLGANALIFGTNNTERGRFNDTGCSMTSTRLRETQGADVASAGDLTLGTDGNTFEITGVTTINAITIANWQNGSKITLIFAGILTVNHNTAGGAGTAPILLAAGVAFSTTAGDVLSLVLSEQGGTQAWREISRTVI